MNKVQGPTVRKTLTVATSRISWQPLIILVVAIVVMSVVVLSGEELKHVPPAAPSFVVLHSFDGADGGSPYAGLLRDSAGNLYGTTAHYGSGGCFFGTSGCGTVFKLSPTGTETVLHSFAGSPDGGNSVAGLVQDAAGNLYGTTLAGGSSSGECRYRDGCGVVFKLSPTGTETVLHTFSGGYDGDEPYAGLLRDPAGNLYGTTRFGGATSTCLPPIGCGVVFELIRCNSGYDFKVLYTFTGGTDGLQPVAGLVRDAAGNLYGTNVAAVFKLSPGGTFTVLHSLERTGGEPVSGLILDAAGNLYGTTAGGGASGLGAVFKLSPTGAETVLYNFTGGADGGSPRCDYLIRDGSGNLYGTTYFGGAFHFGVVFKVSPSGTETVLYSFTGGADGRQPQAGLIQDPAGNLYGTTAFGGYFSPGCDIGCGVVFKLTPY